LKSIGGGAERRSKPIADHRKGKREGVKGMKE
jgi:hypothetical protein